MYADFRTSKDESEDERHLRRCTSLGQVLVSLAWSSVPRAYSTCLPTYLYLPNWHQATPRYGAANKVG